MLEVLDKKKIRKVFRDVQRHLAIAQLIRRFSTNKEDIRKTALNHVDLSNCHNVLELGCAFGAFTEALKDRLHSDATITGIDIIPEYKPFFWMPADEPDTREHFFLPVSIKSENFLTILMIWLFAATLYISFLT